MSQPTMAELSEEEFRALLEPEIPALISFLTLTVGDRQQAEELFQETCLELWRQRALFERGTQFAAWARTVAKFQLKRYWQKHSRDRSINWHDHHLLRLEKTWLAERDRQRDQNQRMSRLEECFGQLDQDQQDLIRRRYRDGVSHQALAHETQRTVSAVKMLLLRLRRKLADCVMREGHHG